MIRKFSRLFTRERRSSLVSQLDQVYSDIRQVQENNRLAKLYADQEQAKELARLKVEEEKLTKKLKTLDTHALQQSIPLRSGRAW